MACIATNAVSQFTVYVHVVCRRIFTSLAVVTKPNDSDDASLTVVPAGVMAAASVRVASTAVSEANTNEDCAGGAVVAATTTATTSRNTRVVIGILHAV